MKKNIKTHFNIHSQRLLVILSFFGLLYSFYITFFTNNFYYFVMPFLLGKFIVGLFATQMALHRYFSHKSFSTDNLRHKFLCLISLFAGQGSPVAWAAHHRHHHIHADTEFDTHSPKESKFFASGFWIFRSYDFYLIEKKLRKVPTDLLRDSFIKFIDSNYYYIWAILIFTIGCLNYKFLLLYILAPVAWGIINSAFITLLSHIKLPGSYRNYNTLDDSYNNKFIQIYMLGEAHNNHHYNPSNYIEAVKKGEFDLVGYLINKLFVVSEPNRKYIV